MKLCSTCGEYKELNKFKFINGYLSSPCNECNAVKERKRYYKKRREVDVNYLVRDKISNCNASAKKGGYKTVVTPIHILIERFTTVCEVCSKECGSRINLDHCHITGVFRAFLCIRCNIAIELGAELLVKLARIVVVQEDRYIDELLDDSEIEKLLEV